MFILNALSERSNGPITLGSLFDGIGAFPYAASFFGITPIWASEILPNAVSITKRHFPETEHLGDITKLDGGKIPPVGLLCFGSPCQSFSVAAGGNRTGFAGKSGLFWEAVRIIKEMRCATSGKYPQIICFENVYGILNCNSGRDYQAVVSAFCETEVPMPASGKWANAGMVRGGSVDFAWIVKDSAKHYRVPQRRRRLFAVVDFTGRRAAEILFEPKSLSGYFAARGFSRQSASSDARSGAQGAGGGDVTAAFMAGQAKNAGSIAYSESLSPTLKGAASGLNQTPSVLCAATGQPGRAAVAFAQNGRNEVRDLGDAAGCLVAVPGVKQQTYIIQSNCRVPQETRDAKAFAPSGAAPALSGADPGGGGNPAGPEANPVRTKHIIRKLTPIECERLMSLPDGYTAIGHDGKMMSDSARYSMCGNSVVVNVLAYIMQNIAERLYEEATGKCRNR